jgi:hypothetical protein
VSQVAVEQWVNDGTRRIAIRDPEHVQLTVIGI